MSIMKKAAAKYDNHNDRPMPAEAKEYHDDVTKEAVDKMRELAREPMSAGDWEVIDGFGRTGR